MYTKTPMQIPDMYAPAATAPYKWSAELTRAVHLSHDAGLLDQHKMAQHQCPSRMRDAKSHCAFLSHAR